MDSENEVVIVDDNSSTTNGIGFNGNHEETLEMRTRSKVAGEEDSTKPKLRSNRNVSTTAVAQTATVSSEKATADNEKKDSKKANQRAVVTDEVNSKKELALSAVTVDSNSDRMNSKESSTTSGGAASTTARSNAQDTKAASNSSVVTRKNKASDEETGINAATSQAAGKKRTSDREDDSGINSRASSVSNEDFTPRMRTRSSRSSDIATTSTPLQHKKGQARMPLSTYDFEDVTFDEEELTTVKPPTSSAGSLKRKAVLYIEEMDDDDSIINGNEPLQKRPALAERSSSNLIYELFNPLRKLPWKLKFGIGPRSETAVAEVDAATYNSMDSPPVALSEAPKTTVLSQDVRNENSSPGNANDSSATCKIM